MDRLLAVGFDREMQRALEADAERLRDEGIEVEVSFTLDEAPGQSPGHSENDTEDGK